MFSQNLHNLLQQLEPGKYRCVRVLEDTRLASNENVYAVPLSIIVPLAIAGAVYRKGYEDGHSLVILCDDLQKFMEYHRAENEQYLRDLSLWLNRQSIVTFLGASQLTWDGKTALAYDLSKGDHVLQLGWD